MKLIFQAYVTGSVEAVALYQRAFGAVLAAHEMDDDGTYLLAELHRDGQPFLSVCESGRNMVIGNTMQFSVTGFADEASLLQAYTALADGAAVINPPEPCRWSSCRADLVDRFGVYWSLSV